MRALVEHGFPGGLVVADAEFLVTANEREPEEELDGAIALANRSPYGNGAVIYTRSGGAARKFARNVNCGMIGVNIG
ncbi:MAG: aldehyde dehydrogenase family protein, partial [Acidobacteriota bacterium]